MRCAVFMERDGVLNRELADSSGLRTPLNLEEFSVLDDAAGPLQSLREAGLLVIVTTNQPGVSQGTLPRRDLDLMHRIMLKHLPVDDILVCPHSPSDHCPCRKPKPGLLLEAAFRWHIAINNNIGTYWR